MDPKINICFGRVEINVRKGENFSPFPTMFSINCVFLSESLKVGTMWQSITGLLSKARGDI